MVDFLKKNKIKVFGPNKYAAQLEGSKTFSKDLVSLHIMFANSAKQAFSIIEMIL